MTDDELDPTQDPEPTPAPEDEPEPTPDETAEAEAAEVEADVDAGADTDEPDAEPEPEAPEPASVTAEVDAPAAVAANVDDQEFDEREDLFGFEEFVVENAAAEDDFNVDELLDAIAEIPGESDEEEADEEAEDELVPAGGDVDADLLRQLLTAQQQMFGDEEEGGGGFSLRGGGRAVSKLALVVVVAVTLLNAGVVGASWMLNKGIEQEMLRAVDDVIAVTGEARRDFEQSVTEIEALQGPLTNEDPVYSRTFTRVQELLDEGEYLEARRHLYALLAVLDRLDPAVREDAEARASFLLGDTLRLEALAREHALAVEDDQ